MSKFSICIATYKRPKGLQRLLQSLDNLELNVQSSDITVVVVDNDKEMSSEEVVSRWAEKAKFKVVYAHEPQRGIPYARNRCCLLADDTDYVLFIDDDEVADSRWLLELREAQRKFNADVVVGAVLSVFEVDVPDWLRSEFERPRYKIGTVINTLNTGNVMIRRSILRNVEGPFDTSRTFSGGTDTLLGCQLNKMGARIIWADDAKVSEIIPINRARLSWLLQREFRGGNAFSVQLRLLKASKIKLVTRFLKCLAKIILGFGLMAYGFLLSYKKAVVGMSLMANGAGGVSGMLGLIYNEYACVNNGQEKRWQWLKSQ